MFVSRASRAAISVACAALLLATSGCGSDKPEGATTSTQVRLYGTDGNMQNSYVAELKDRGDLVNGMKGTIPLTPLPESFKERLRTVDPGLKDYLYSAETYDAVVISSLAAQLAGSTDPRRIAEQIVGVTTNGQRCDDPATCLRLARNGQDIEYRGVSLNRAGFTDAGEPATASYATLHFDDEKIDDGKTEFVGAGDESGASTKAPPRAKRQRGDKVDKAAGAPLILGGLLPKTGDLALAYPPIAAGAALALKDVNSAGGVLGAPVTWIDGDDGTNPQIAKATVASHVAKGVHVIIGAAASGISRAVLPDVVAAGRVLFSPSNTDAGLTTVDDKGLYFRTAPPDSLQGRALADVILRDGPHKIAIVARKDSYGEGLQENVRAELERAGLGADRVKLLSYAPPANPKAPPVDFGDGARQIKDFGADAVLVIGFGESARVILALAEAGVQIRH
ncbi:ABC transporter substrate-binding protein [Micromonospora auratinigra]|uniref:Amino acid/amide ABC transporter substrate-binding protein, HAAT family (TC 3.A.1.4.-) n=1 Tax=Micromonospora auratinigra TaxID=261654 RepID=A0A1A9A2F1_9ACTN|nr:ABC transporter substrate-binding protein [Micromonospora auratinigra]SBT50370.1 amino acid/amide ABC transporter substrate-binding protein, HAAT family (TC 3.A.1.4.-) [Micromonospora auratinigra]